MPSKFVMKGYEERTIHGSHSIKPLEISGIFNMSGPQPVNDKGGAPQWVADVFDLNPKINLIAVGTETGGVVWQRME